MPVSVTMPRLGESVTEGTVTRWLKQEGERVEADEPLLEVSTDKVDTEIPSPAAGVLTRIVVGEDETAEVGSELAVIAGEGEDAGSAAPAPAQQAAAEPEPAAPVTPSTEKPVEAEAPAPQTAAPAGNAEGTEIKLPALGESVTEGTITRWLKQVGEEVEADEPLVEVSTDKVDTEIPSPVAGTLLEIRVGEDETADVGAVLAVIGAAGSAPAAAPAPEKPAPAPAPAPAQAPAPKVESAPAPKIESAPAPQVAPEPAKAPAPAAVESNGAGDAGYVTPLVRKLAAEKGVDLSTLTGTGVGGRIRKQDVIDAAEKAAAAKAAPAPAAQAERAAAPVEKAAAKAEPSPLRGRTEKLTRIRATIARRMVESLQVSAQLTTVVEVDVTKIANLRNKAKADFQAKHGVKLTFLPFFALATVEALQQHPVVNSSIDVEAGTVTYHGSEHLGIAVDAPKGLVVPVIKDAGDLNLGGLAKRIADVAERTRNNKIGPDELGGGTFTLTNTGSRGALFDTPIINQPQVGILGLGAVVKRPVIVNDPDLGEIIAPRSMVYLALSYDHRIVDGADAARFLGTLKERLEGGHFEADLGL
ncbi:2-oxoglutarate dehydrogenase E2 component (dihydrolipoamide succinyltransferase) [Actinoplanes campanulatus]|uniref:Dihydrolipoamide acetyltransferase component of pyruvate dehydrogenase complex n=1 Tax=Actinoplanes campanulatus TaxID=113559 RepID=A0A7W5APD1_9ACTN|nr:MULTISPECIES: 2-oxoglutarate dehydrogenase, E2 component, dihydrolipoamide succinyltransferase [Actinoplanes]MBB3099977.1 2-oxoglutarate dehydrogenase E2 component (dihydrolipoamide succinyltransferase) [Actinoplanes campanulatus]GGN29675.1 dihydrolipoamide acetyltransferase component of pyruvate dehydrogenase complex [Actinoplanes campanulatus]GID42215.1 dihydrolipoamide acetyltransferase component of pyruvate dehydrogenase complex [Actinoplanes campanulatus]GID44759.1 dihydrolipoamide acet